MAPPVPTTLPPALNAGLTWTWSRTFSEFPATEGWAITARVVGPETSIEVPASGTGAEWLFEAAASETSGLRPGPYAVRVIAARGAEVRRVEEVRLQVLPDVESDGGTASQSHPERMLTLCEALLEGRAVSDIESYGVTGRQLTKIPFEKLMQARNRYAAAVQRERGLQRAPLLIGFGGVR